MINGMQSHAAQDGHATLHERIEAPLRERIKELEARVKELEDALDHQMVITHLGVFNTGDDPVKAINALMYWSYSLGEYNARDSLINMERVALLESLLEEALGYTSCPTWSPSLTAEIQAALKKEKPTMICPRCKVDRFKEPCPNDIGCPMVATAHKEKP
jgi:hypothetical protein